MFTLLNFFVTEKVGRLGGSDNKIKIVWLGTQNLRLIKSPQGKIYG